MENKVKVKDLAAEMGVTVKDLSRVFRDLDVEIKSTASSVSADDAARAKAKMQAEGSIKTEVMRTEIQPGVIVRRRKSRDGEGEAEAGKPLQVQTGLQEGVQDAVQEKAPAIAKDEAALSVAKVAKVTETVSVPSDKAAPKAEKQESAKPKAEKSPDAKIVSVAKVIKPAQPEKQPVEEAPVVKEAQQEVLQAAEVSLEAVLAPAAAAVLETAPVVEKTEAFAPGEAAVAPAQVSEQPAREKVAEGDTRRKRPAKVETPPARIVRPAPAPVDPAPVVKEAAESAEAQAERKDGRRVQPSASAMPEGSSRPSLLPPVTEGRRYGDSQNFSDEGEADRARRKSQDAPTSHVKVISRPDFNAQPRPAPTADRGPDNRDRGDSRGPRPAGAGAPRPAGGAPRPGGFRPASSQGAPFTPPSTPPVEGADQSRKKRNKNVRRTVDFPQDTNDFSRRRTGDDDEGSSRSRSRGRKPKKAVVVPQSTQPMKAAKRKIRVEEAIRVSDMAHQMGLKSGEIIKVLFGLGVMATINNALDIETATLVAAEFGYEIEKVGFSEDDYLVPIEVDSVEQLKPRPPVVTIMGHVDHGKTSLLDAIRKTNVTGGEAGGITQHIGAYHVSTKRGEIVFLDTPGHEAFTSMRARGAQVTDLVVLVVAADDGVMEQTREAINHSKAAGVPIMVAVNKIDKEAANADRVLRELSELGLQAESWGGDVVVSMVSAKTREGLDELLELIALQAEVLELKANPDKPARGRIVEAKLDKGRGPVATVLIQEGTLHHGDAFVCGVFSGRVRAMFNDQGRKVKEAGPAMPVEVQGFEGVPEAGEEFICLTDEKAVRRIAEARSIKQRERELAKESRVTLETFLSRRADATETMVLNLVLKADVQGSLEAIAEALRKLSTEKVRIEIIHAGAGAISESDIMLAAASDAIVIGFNVRPSGKVKDVAESEKVDIRFYDIIYKLVDEIKSAMAGMLAPVKREVYLGQAEVRQVFSLPKVGAVAGSHVSDGKITRNAGVRLLRDSVVVYTGKVASLRRIKDDVKEVLKGYECGIGLENFGDIKIGDIIEAFEIVEEAATL